MSAHQIFQVPVSLADKKRSAVSSALFRLKQKAKKEGWTDLDSVWTETEAYVHGSPPQKKEAAVEATPKSEPEVQTKAKKKVIEPKPTKEEKEAPAPKSKTNRDGQVKLSTGKAGPRPIGLTTGVGIEKTWGQLFESEEAKPTAKRKSDKELTEMMNKEFPGRNSRVFARVSEVRTKWRNGKFGYQLRGEKAGEE